MRLELEKLHKQTITIEATIDRRGRVRSGDPRLCLKDVIDANTKEFLTDHVWINEESEVKNLFLEPGDSIRLTVEVHLYKKSTGVDFGIRNPRNVIKKEDISIYFAIPSKELEQTLNEPISRKKFHACPTDALVDWRLVVGKPDRSVINLYDDEFSEILSTFQDVLDEHGNFIPLAKKLTTVHPSDNFAIIELNICSFDISKKHSRYLMVSDINKISLNRYVTVKKKAAIYRKDFFKERFVERICIDYISSMDILIDSNTAEEEYGHTKEKVLEEINRFKQAFYSESNLRARDSEFIEKVKWTTLK